MNNQTNIAQIELSRYDNLIETEKSFNALQKDMKDGYTVVCFSEDILRAILQKPTGSYFKWNIQICTNDEIIKNLSDENLRLSKELEKSNIELYRKKQEFDVLKNKSDELESEKLFQTEEKEPTFIDKWGVYISFIMGVLLGISIWIIL